MIYRNCIVDTEDGPVYVDVVDDDDIAANQELSALTQEMEEPSTELNPVDKIISFNSSYHSFLDYFENQE